MRGEFLLGLSREVRTGAGVDAEQTVDVHLELDREERVVEVPAALAEALAGDDEAKSVYDGLAYTHRKEFSRWIDEAKREETRAKRVTKTLEMLRDGQTRS